MNDTTTESAKPSAESWYLLLVGGLGLLIIVLLAFLWLRERGRRHAAEQEAAGLQRLLAASMLAPAGPGARLRAGTVTRPAARPIPREDLPVETVRWNGRPRDVLRIGAAGGRRLGLRPGDVLVVSEEPTTAPHP